MPGKKLAYVLRTPRSRALAVAVVISAAAAAVVVGRQPSQPNVTAQDVQIQDAATVQSTPQKAPAPRAQARRTAPSATRATTAVPARTVNVDATTAKAVAPASTSAAVSLPAPTAGVQDSPAITIAGCLEQDDDKFRLKDTAGTEAPKSRSWRSGFLKKGSASIDVVDASNRLRFPNHVGEWVSVTGTMVEDEMQVRSLQRVAASCKDKPEA